MLDYIPTRSEADVTYLIDIQQAVRNPYCTAITVDYTCTGYGCRSGMIVYFLIFLFRSYAPYSYMWGAEPTISRIISLT